MPETLKLAIVTDIHHGPEKYSKKGEAALPMLARFARFVDDYAPDMAVDLGDRITDIDVETDRRLMREVADAFAAMAAPRAHLVGNHDVAHLAVADNEAAFDRPMRHYSIDLKGWHLTFWQPDSRLALPDGFTRRQDDLDWLVADLAATNLPAVVFSHVPLDAASMAGNYWFENNPDYATLPHHEEVRRCLQDAGNVVLCIAGHVHWNNLSVIDGISYITVQSLTESFTTNDVPAGAWASIELGEDLLWRTHGADPIEVRRPLRGGNERWLKPLPHFKELQTRTLMRAGLDDIEGLILDMDGVLYRGEAAIPGAAEAVAALREAGLRLVAVTNNARATPAQYAEKLARLGMELPTTDIVTSGQAVARYLSTREARPRVFIAGSAALRAEVLAAGAVESETEPAYVVAGIDFDMPLKRLGQAVGHVIAGAELIASNADPLVPAADGFEPEAGAVVSFLERSTGKQARILGKPDPGIFELALERLGLPRLTVAVVGDTPETDIAGATAAGLRSIHLASGNPVPDGWAPVVPSYPDLAAAAAILATR